MILFQNSYILMQKHNFHFQKAQCIAKSLYLLKRTLFSLHLVLQIPYNTDASKQDKEKTMTIIPYPLCKIHVIHFDVFSEVQYQYSNY